MESTRTFQISPSRQCGIRNHLGHISLQIRYSYAFSQKREQSSVLPVRHQIVTVAGKVLINVKPLLIRIPFCDKSYIPCSSSQPFFYLLLFSILRSLFLLGIVIYVPISDIRGDIFLPPGASGIPDNSLKVLHECLRRTPSRPS